MTVPRSDDALELLRAGRLREGIREVRRFTRASTSTEATAQLKMQAWRLVGVHMHMAGHAASSHRWVRRSLAMAEVRVDELRVAEAMNTMAAFAIDSGRLSAALKLLLRARRVAPPEVPLHAHLALNIGTVESIRGNMPRAVANFRIARKLALKHGLSAIEAQALHNLSLLAQKAGDWHEANRLAAAAARQAEAIGDGRLKGIVGLVSVRAALEQTRYALAETRLRTAADDLRRTRSSIDFPDVWLLATRICREQEDPRAVRFGTHAVRRARARALPLTQGEAEQELALWHQSQGDSVMALRHLSRAVRLFREAGAVSDATTQKGRLRSVVQQFVAVVRRWGRSLEAADSYTFGHSERVARYAVELARVLECDSETRTTIRVGAYLHDVGKMRVPVEVLNKPGRLTPEEFAEMQRHPEYGVALLKDVELPWEVLPIVRSHHEHADGSGYPDRLVGDAIPLTAQIVSVADVFDALTSSRPYRPAMTAAAALDEMHRTRAWWSPELLAAAEQRFLGGFAV